MGSLFGTDGVRGRAHEGPLAPDAVVRLARAVGSLLRERPALFSTRVPARFRKIAAAAGTRKGVLIGRDTRESGPEIEKALAGGFLSAGVPVFRAGVLTTPGVAALARKWRCALGAVISASHNPADDNGIKFFSPQGFKIPDAAEQAVEERMGGELPEAGERARARDFSRRTREYVGFLARFSRRLSGMRVAVDCAHGAASVFAGPLLRRLGARAIVTGAEPDGRNINAGVGALHPEAVAAVVRREKADLGVAFDGDADRAIFVDETGAIRDGDYVLAVAGLHLKAEKRLPGATVVSTVMANFGLERCLREHGIRLLRTKVGDRYVAEEMLRSGAVLGGEQSGHTLFFDAAPAGDGMLTMLRMLDLLAGRGEPLSRLCAVLEKCPQTLVNVPVGRKPPIEQVPALREAVASAERALHGEGRVLVRYSGTETLCRVMVEGPEMGLVERLARGVADAVRKELA